MILKPFKTLLFQALLASAVVFTLGGQSYAEDAKATKSDVSPWWDSKWPTRKKVTIDMTKDGVPIAEPVGTTAALVRLHDGNFNFLAAKEDGTDLRFVTDDGKTLLKHHIEKWDTLLNEGYVWVQLPDLKPASALKIWLYYGNTMDTTLAVASKDTFDADTTLALHFGDTLSAASDSSASAVKAEGVPAPFGSLIAGGLRVLGLTSITVPAAPQLEWAAGGAVTWSAWINPSTLAPKVVIFSRRDGASSFVIGLENGVPYVEINKQRSSAAEPLAVNVWRHLAVVVSNSTATVYLDGKSYGALNAVLPALKGPSFLGKDGDPAGAAMVGFSGEIDEVQIARIARPAGFLKFVSVNQGKGSEATKLVDVGSDEAAGKSTGGAKEELAEQMMLIKDISKSLTLDGWVVIYLCAILAIIGWMVAIGKLLYLNKIGKATTAFLQRWKKLSADLTAIDHSDEESVKSLGGAASPKAHKLMRHSPLYHIYHIGSDEIGQRLQNVSQISIKGAVKSTRGLSSRSMQAIKATLHTGLVREVEKLNSKLVFLTIGIAGGPYLGLLGTVIGVMITFAVIAKTGEVEVNSIAPGIAGALLATVAGLAVAIPALFAYSYLSTRIRQAVNAMETFIDEFLTRMAEHYPEAND